MWSAGWGIGEWKAAGGIGNNVSRVGWIRLLNVMDGNNSEDFVERIYTQIDVHSIHRDLDTTIGNHFFS